MRHRGPLAPPVELGSARTTRRSRKESLKEALDARRHPSPILRIAQWERAEQLKRSGPKETGTLEMRRGRLPEDRPPLLGSPGRPPSQDGGAGSRR
eukprot:756695-Lingulodinium_polyedra.AAC.1